MENQLHFQLHRNTQLDLNNASLRSIANKPSGQIAMSDLYGK